MQFPFMCNTILLYSIVSQPAIFAKFDIKTNLSRIEFISDYKIIMIISFGNYIIYLSAFDILSCGF